MTPLNILIEMFRTKNFPGKHPTLIKHPNMTNREFLFNIDRMPFSIMQEKTIRFFIEVEEAMVDFLGHLCRVIHLQVFIIIWLIIYKLSLSSVAVMAQLHFF